MTTEVNLGHEEIVNFLFELFPDRSMQFVKLLLPIRIVFRYWKLTNENVVTFGQQRSPTVSDSKYLNWLRLNCLKVELVRDRSFMNNSLVEESSCCKMPTVIGSSWMRFW